MLVGVRPKKRSLPSTEPNYYGNNELLAQASYEVVMLMASVAQAQAPALDISSAGCNASRA